MNIITNTEGKRRIRTTSGPRLARRDMRDASPARADQLTVARHVRNTARWRRLRARHKRLCPICCDPLSRHVGRVMPNDESHHIVGIAVAPGLAYKFENLAPLCTACHHAIELRERRGEPTQYLFNMTE